MNVYICLHIAQLGIWEKVLHELLNDIQKSCLDKFKILYCVLGPNPKEAQEILNAYFPKEKIKCLGTDRVLTHYECYTLEKIQKHAQNHKDAVYLYLHMKGSTHANNSAQQEWRRYMSYFLLGKADICLSTLKMHHTVGVNMIRNLTPIPHYSGNFWWSRGEYLANRPSITSCPEDRYEAEMWILGKPYQGIHASLHQPRGKEYIDLWRNNILELENYTIMPVQIQTFSGRPCPSCSCTISQCMSPLTISMIVIAVIFSILFIIFLILFIKRKSSK